MGAICQPFLVAHKIAELVDKFPTYCTLRIIQNLSGYITSGVSLLTSAAVSIDRLLAVTLHLRYSVIVTVPRVFQTAFTLWIFSIAVVIVKVSKVLDEICRLENFLTRYLVSHTFCDNL